MICKNCGKALNGYFYYCPACGLPTGKQKEPPAKKSKAKRAVVIVLAPLVLLGGVTAVLFGLARLQRGNQTDSSAADTPNITEEEAQEPVSAYVEPLALTYDNPETSDTGNSLFTYLSSRNIVIPDKEKAAEVIIETEQSIDLSSADNTLTFLSEFKSGGNTFYRFQQNYKGIPVYGRDVILTADARDYAYSLSSNMIDCAGIDVYPKLNPDDVTAIASKFLHEVSEGELDDSPISTPDLCVFTFDNASALAYRVSCGGMLLFFDADDGNYLGGVLEYQGITMDGELDSFDLGIDSSGDYLTFLDAGRNISINKLDSEYWMHPEDYSVFKVKNDPVSFNTTDVKVAVETLGNMERIYDFFSTTLGYRGLDGTGSVINVYFYVKKIPRVFNGKDNAFYWDGTDTGYGEMIAICPIDYFDHYLSAHTDIMAHEFTHAIVRHTADFGVSRQSDAMNEAFADILGECAEAAIQGRAPNWIIGNNESIRDLNDLDNSVEGGTHITQYSEYSSDTECHNASTLISHIAYSIYNGMDTGGFTAAQTAVNDSRTMARLWYTTLLQLHGDATFMDCRYAIENAAGLLGLSDAQKAGIAKAFDDAGLTINETPSGTGEAEYAAYAAVLEKFTDKYGLPARSYEEYPSSESLCRLIDFNNDGISELYLAGTRDGSTDVMIYTLVGGRPVLFYDKRGLNPYSVDDYEVILYNTSDRNYYLCTYQYGVPDTTYCQYKFDGRKFVGISKKINMGDYASQVGEIFHYNGHSYLFIKVSMSDDQTVSGFQHLGGYFAHINDRNENEFLAERVRELGLEFAYFGYSDDGHEGNWTWLDDRQSDYENWRSGEPNNEEGREHYALIYTNGEWNDGKFDQDVSDGRAYAICEFDNRNGIPYDPEFTSFKICWDSFYPTEFEAMYRDMEQGEYPDGSKTYVNYGFGSWFVSDDRYAVSAETYQRITGSEL